MLASRVGVSVFVAAVLGLLALGSLASSSSGDDSVSVDEKPFENWWSDLEKGETPATGPCSTLPTGRRPQPRS